MVDKVSLGSLIITIFLGVIPLILPKLPPWALWGCKGLFLIAIFLCGVFFRSFFSRGDGNSKKPLDRSQFGDGSGGNASVNGDNSGAEGGAGGVGGLIPGGSGGNAAVTGNNSFARGGDGGNAPQWDGRGGRRALSQGERMNSPTDTWKYGYGGRGANHPEYDRRLKILTQIRQEYMNSFPDDVQFIQAGIDRVPIRWVNKRLEEVDETWRVTMSEEGYELPPLDQDKL